MSQPRRKPKLSSEFIPDDVVFDILTRFPVKSLIRFRCVSKSYNSTMTSPIFITKHFNLNQAKSLSNNHNIYLLYPISDPEICAVVCNSALTEISRFQIPFPRVNVVGFCNGIFCLYNYRDDTIYLWNPSIKKSKMLATTPPTFKTKFPYFNHGLAYHSQNNDFKILRIIVSYYGTSMVLPEASVYTLSTDSWRRVVVPVGSLTQSIHSILETPFIFFNGALHCIANTTRGDSFILCFDVNDERFREILLPANDLRFKQLVVFKGSLALVGLAGVLIEEGYICHIWVMREYGVVESWTRSTVPLNNVQSPRWLRYTTDFMESLVLVDGENQD